MKDAGRRRRRPAISCTLCRKRKIRCNRQLPCSNCLRSRNGTCAYETLAPKSPEAEHHESPNSQIGSFPTPIDSVSNATLSSTDRILALGSAEPTSTNSESTPETSTTAWHVESMRNRVRQAEDNLSKLSSSANEPVFSDITRHTHRAKSTGQTVHSEVSGTFHVHHDNQTYNRPQSIMRHVYHKNRLFGQSHWCNEVVAFRDIFVRLEPHIRSDSSISAGVKKCKQLAVVIKSQRSAPWPAVPDMDLPQKDIADVLVDNYLRTSECMYRILHRPTFQASYDALWVSESVPDIGFVVQLKLVLAIGAAVYDENFALRPSAIKWIYEAQTWISQPEFKARLSIQALQSMLLFILARDFAGVAGSLTWVGAGTVLRTAIYMGMHRDPSRLPQQSQVASELRRRLWNTVLELNLQSCMVAGGPPLMSIDDFDTEPPGNFDDDHLLAQDPSPSPSHVFTQSSIAIALRQSFPVRLAIAKYLNEISSRTAYQQTLQLDKELKDAYKSLRTTLQTYKSNAAASPSQLELSLLDYTMSRYKSALHVPFLNQSFNDAAYAYSRKVAVETSFKIWRAVYRAKPCTDSQSGTDVSFQNELSRLAVCTSGAYRTAVVQAIFVIAAELRAQIQEDESISPTAPQSDLLCVLSEAKDWSVQCINAGETNMKGFLFVSVLAAQIYGARRGLGQDELSAFMAEECETVVEKSLQILQGKITRSSDEGVEEQTYLNATTEDGEDGAFMSMFGAGSAESMEWGFPMAIYQDSHIW